MVEEEEKTMIPVEVDWSSLFSPASQNELGPSERVSSGGKGVRGGTVPLR